MFWILLPAILFFLGFVLIFAIGSFIPHTTNMCVVDVKRNIDQCFALANNLELYPKYFNEILNLSCEGDSFANIGAKGQITIESKAFDFESTDFIPNYRIAVKHLGDLDHWTFQLSLYRLSLNSTRLVLISSVKSESRFRRASNAFNRKKRERYFNRLLDAAKKCVETEGDVSETFSDVSPELNPNFSLH